MRDFHREDFDTAEQFYQAFMVENARARLKKPVFPDQGPREWTPRIAKAVIKVEFLRSLIPIELLKEVTYTETRWDSLTGKRTALMLRVNARKWKNSCKKHYPSFLDACNSCTEHWVEDNVWIDQNGMIVTEAGIRDLLTGKTKGYTHLAGRWEEWLAILGVSEQPDVLG